MATTARNDVSAHNVRKTQRFSRRTGSLWYDVTIYILVTSISVLMLYPFLYIIAVSLSDPTSILNSYLVLWPVHPTAMLYKYIFHIPSIYQDYLNSVMYTVVGTFVSVVLTILCAYPLSKPWLYGRRTVIVYITITMFVSGGLIPQFLLVKYLGIYNTMWAIILPGAMSTFLMIVTLTFFRGIPLDFEEVAAIEGASDFLILTKIFLPLSKPIVATISLFYGVGYWNSWFPAAIYLDDQSKWPVQLLLRNLMAGQSIDMTELTAVLGNRLNTFNPMSLDYALIVAVIVPIIFVYPFVQRFFVKGAMVGSLKG